MSDEEILKKHGFKPEVWEESKNQFLKSPFPQSVKRYRIIWEIYN